MKSQTKSTLTAAYRQSNYLFVDNKHNSVGVSVYFRTSHNGGNPSFKQKMRSIKNSVHNYDEGQIMVRELTSDTNILPHKSLLNDLVQYLIRYENMSDLPTFTILWKRLTDYPSLRHVEKSLLVIEHLLNQKPPLYSISFEKYCKDRKPEFIKLRNYRFKIDGSEIGRNVRERAANIYQILFKSNEIQSVDNTKASVIASAPKRKHHKKKKKKRKKYEEVDDEKVDTNEPYWVDCEDNNDIFDIFGELPVVQNVDNDHDNDFENVFI